ncbi:MAG: response regulator transcription factor [Paludibacteraceae bacterium]|nr:response regulator transcription factor [Paludibacteraceae bacterium]
MKCTVIDDEPYALELIKDYILRTPFLELAKCFSNPFKAMDFLNKERIDLVFLDINMPEISGIQLYKSLNIPPMVIFTTAYPEFAAESYEYNAIDYLVKPIKYERFLKAVNKASGFINTPPSSDSQEVKSVQTSKDNCLFIKSGSQLVKIYPNDILYIEAAGNYMCFHTREKKVMTLLNAKEVLELLPGNHFVRIHKSYIISIDHIDAIERHDVIVNGKLIPIGITYREHFLSLMKR